LIKRNDRSFGVALFILLTLFMVGCTEKTETEQQDENIETIEAVLQTSLTGPDDELIQILDENFDALGQYEENRYKDYFADETSYMEFVSRYGSVLMIEPIRNDYKLTVKNIEYEKTDSKEIIYNFSVELQYQKDGAEKSEVEIVTGQANLNEDHKLENMLIRVNDLWVKFIK
jgi:hypothetical protein